MTGHSFCKAARYPISSRTPYTCKTVQMLKKERKWWGATKRQIHTDLLVRKLATCVGSNVGLRLRPQWTLASVVYHDLLRLPRHMFFHIFLTYWGHESSSPYFERRLAFLPILGTECANASIENTGRVVT